MYTLARLIYFSILLLLTNASFAETLTILQHHSLPKELNEASALIEHNHTLWTINDEGRPFFLYQINQKNGRLIKKIKMNGFKAKDTEALASTKTNLFIADIGNNAGNRHVFSIYRYKWSTIERSRYPKPNLRIRFKLPDYHPGNYINRKHPFDMEAMLYKNSHLLLFTKNWEKNTSTIYRISIQKKRSMAKKIAHLNTCGLITDATWLSKDQIAFVGYQIKLFMLKPFLFTAKWPLGYGNNTPYCHHDFLLRGQIEGISSSKKNLYLISENFRSSKGRLYHATLK